MGAYKTWAWADGLPHGLPHGYPMGYLKNEKKNYKNEKNENLLIINFQL